MSEDSESARDLAVEDVNSSSTSFEDSELDFQALHRRYRQQNRELLERLNASREVIVRRKNRLLNHRILLVLNHMLQIFARFEQALKSRRWQDLDTLQSQLLIPFNSQLQSYLEEINRSTTDVVGGEQSDADEMSNVTVNAESCSTGGGSGSEAPDDLRRGSISAASDSKGYTQPDTSSNTNASVGGAMPMTFSMTSLHGDLQMDKAGESSNPLHSEAKVYIGDSAETAGGQSDEQVNVEWMEPPSISVKQISSVAEVIRFKDEYLRYSETMRRCGKEPRSITELLGRLGMCAFTRRYLRCSNARKVPNPDTVRDSEILHAIDVNEFARGLKVSILNKMTKSLKSRLEEFPDKGTNSQPKLNTVLNAAIFTIDTHVECYGRQDLYRCLEEISTPERKRFRSQRKQLVADICSAAGKGFVS